MRTALPNRRLVCRTLTLCKTFSIVRKTTHPILGIHKHNMTSLINHEQFVCIMTVMCLRSCQSSQYSQAQRFIVLLPAEQPKFDYKITVCCLTRHTNSKHCPVFLTIPVRNIQYEQYVFMMTVFVWVWLKAIYEHSVSTGCQQGCSWQASYISAIYGIYASKWHVFPDPCMCQCQSTLLLGSLWFCKGSLCNLLAYDPSGIARGTIRDYRPE